MTEITVNAIIIPPWAVMWVIALALFAIAKWVTWRRTVGAGVFGSPGRTLGYLFAWVGMDANSFLRPGASERPAPRAWVAPVGRMMIGAAMLWIGSSLALRLGELPAAWTGLIGLILLLHFGTFDLLSLLWRAAGVNALPLMDSPGRSLSLAEFWGRRWNAGFHRLADDLLWRPLV